MMVLRHFGPPSTVKLTQKSHQNSADGGDDSEAGDDRGASPIDLSKKPLRRSEPSLQITHSNNNSRHIPHQNHHHHQNHHNNNNHHVLSANSNNKRHQQQQLNHNHDNIIRTRVHPHNQLYTSSTGDTKLLRKITHNSSSASAGQDDDGSYSSPDSGLHRDSPGEDEEVMMKSSSPPLASLGRAIKQGHGQGLIPLSLIRAKYTQIPTNRQYHDDDGNTSSSPPPQQQKMDGRRHHRSNKRELDEVEDDYDEEVDDNGVIKKMPEIVLKKRSRLEEMVTHIKKTTTKPDRSRRNSGDGSSSDQVNSGDEVEQPQPRDMRNLRAPPPLNQIIPSGINRRSLLREELRLRRSNMNEDEPCNLVLHNNNINNNNNNNKSKSRSTTATALNMSTPPPLSMTPESLLMVDNLEAWKKKLESEGNLPLVQSLSPAELSKLYGIDPENYQQQMMQFQLAQAAMLGGAGGGGGDPAGLMKTTMGSYPPWVYLGYYSQILQNFQAQEILRQYAMQSQIPSASQGDTSPVAGGRTLGSSGYNCRSPVSPASLLSEGQTVDSDNGSVGGGHSGSINGGNGKRAPRAMTGRHVRTGTGASPSTLQTLRQKIEERQRLRAQQGRHHESSNNTSFSSGQQTSKSSSSGKSSKKSKK